MVKDAIERQNSAFVQKLFDCLKCWVEQKGGSKFPDYRALLSVLVYALQIHVDIPAATLVLNAYVIQNLSFYFTMGYKSWIVLETNRLRNVLDFVPLCSIPLLTE